MAQSPKRRGMSLGTRAAAVRRSRRTHAPLIAGALFCSGLGGCGAAAPTLAPARPLAPGRAEIALGTAALLTARLPRAPESRTVARVTAASSVVPWVTPRVGLPANNELWAMFSAGSVGLGVRHAWQLQGISLSAGAEGAKMTLGEATEDAPSAEGWQVAIPLLVGWQSDTDLVSAWGGFRARYLHLTAEVPEASIPVEDWATGVVLGLGVGIFPIWARVEVTAEWHQVEIGAPRSGTYPAAGHFGLVSFTPATALAFRF